jgi:hypothetical protein
MEYKSNAYNAIMRIIICNCSKEQLAMVEAETWENKCCRCEGEPKQNLYPGKRACHITCGSCLYPDDWGKCASCEIVGHCRYALDYLRSLKENGIRKGCTFQQQLTGEEDLYHILNFVNGQQQFIQSTSEKAYLEELKKINSTSPCLHE